MEIKRPCPSNLNKMTQSNQGYHCASCDKCVIDFRDKTVEEIKSTLKPGDCGVFLPHQLTGQKRYTGYRRMIFGFLVFCASLGFDVKPLKAQTEVPVEPNTSDSITSNDTITPMIIGQTIMVDQTKIRKDRTAKIKPHRRWRIFRRKRHYKYRTIGCPDF